jgi:hypothetical protein
VSDVHAKPPTASKFHFNIILRNLSRCFWWFLLVLPLRSYMNSSSPHSCYLPSPSYLNLASWLYLSKSASCGTSQPPSVHIIWAHCSGFRSASNVWDLETVARNTWICYGSAKRD